ncbi:30S ribosomal protein S21 [Rarispira pelagica]|uniref:30S ribosomal protein S21 n=1 Tax=Rarispira pelagica TaxID=3141764 RepID=UPI003B283F8E
MITIIHVPVDNNEPLEKALKRFKRFVEKEGVIREWKKREFYVKPSKIKNEKKKAMERKLQKKIRKLQEKESSRR